MANRTETAARVHHAFAEGKVLIEGLAALERTLHMDSRVLEKAEAQDETEPMDATGGDDDIESDDEERPARRLTNEELAERLRVQVDTVGQPGKPGE